MSTNQFIKPITTEYKENIRIGGCDLTELAKQYGTPLYVIDEKTLRTTAKEYKDAFSEFNTKIMYASKAHCNLTIAKILDSEGICFDVVSAGEIYTLELAGVDMKNVIFNGSNKSEYEINYALKHGVGRFSVDNFHEAEVLNKICSENNKNAEILLRITPGIECHTHEYIQTGQNDSKFGFNLSQIDEIVSLIKTEYKNLNLKGLHAHIGSQIFELKSFEDEIEILVHETAKIQGKYGLTLEEINVGGGFGVTYTEKDVPPSIQNVAKVITDALKKSIQKYDLSIKTLYIEPGRSMVSTSGVTLYTVGNIKTVPNGRKYVIVDGGMADNPRYALYKAEYYAEVVNKYNNQNKEKVTIAGRYCESGDILIKDIDIHSVELGDIICVYNTGAYNYSMASNYNRVEKPAMVLVNNSQSDIIVYRESLEDLVVKERIPDRLKNL